MSFQVVMCFSVRLEIKEQRVTLVIIEVNLWPNPSNPNPPFLVGHSIEAPVTTEKNVWE